MPRNRCAGSFDAEDGLLLRLWFVPRSKLPEHRLLDYQQLGHRNFNAFVNQWRRT
jgi:hypothetical protein